MGVALSCYSASVDLLGRSHATRMTRQPIFDFPQEALSFAELRITAPNRDAYTQIRRTAEWPQPVMCLLGPPKCGLTTAGLAWALENDGTMYEAKAISKLSAKQAATLTVDAMVIDAADQARKAEPLITLINRTIAEDGRLLLTANAPPSEWRLNLDDLTSRLKSIPIAEILPPDEDTLMRRLVVSARKYYLDIPPDVLNFLTMRLLLSYEMIEDCLRLLSEKVSENERAPSIPLAREVVIMLGLTEDEAT